MGMLAHAIEVSLGKSYSDFPQNKPDTVAHVCNHSYSGDRFRRIGVHTAHPGRCVRPYLKKKLNGKRAGSVVQMIEHILASARP
jgi:hypothetical protein